MSNSAIGLFAIGKLAEGNQAPRLANFMINFVAIDAPGLYFYFTGTAQAPCGHPRQKRANTSK